MFVVFIAIVFVSIVGAWCRLRIVPIVEWGGSYSLCKEVLRNPVNLVIIQHTVTQHCNTNSDCVELLRYIRKRQIWLGGHEDIGYNFLIGGNGKVYEGAGWHLAGAHTIGYNKKSLGIAFIGEFSNKLPKAKALIAAKYFLQYGVESKHISDTYQLVGHRQLKPTTSPGFTLYAEIQTWPHFSEYGWADMSVK